MGEGGGEGESEGVHKVSASPHPRARGIHQNFLMVSSFGERGTSFNYAIYRYKADKRELFSYYKRIFEQVNRRGS